MYGRIVTNPPYGERLLEREEAGELYKAFGKAMDKLPDTWRVYVLSSHPDFERCYGRFADKKRKLYNGMLKCDLFMYGKKIIMPRAARRGRKQRQWRCTEKGDTLFLEESIPLNPREKDEGPSP